MAAAAAAAVMANRLGIMQLTFTGAACIVLRMVEGSSSLRKEHQHLSLFRRAVAFQ
jgi:hypothetical protein